MVSNNFTSNDDEVHLNAKLLYYCPLNEYVSHNIILNRQLNHERRNIRFKQEKDKNSDSDAELKTRETQSLEFLSMWKLPIDSINKAMSIQRLRTDRFD